MSKLFIGSIDNLPIELNISSTGNDPNAIKKDGSTETTAKIPFAMGASSSVEPSDNNDLTTKNYVDETVNTAIENVHSIPAGGTAGQVLSKVDGENYNVQWSDPTGGSTDPDAIKKDGTTITTAKIPFAMGASSSVEPSEGNDLVTKTYTDNLVSDSFNNVHSIPEGGTAGQVLSKVDGENYNVQWSDPTGGSTDPNAIKKDGTTTTTAPIPFAEGIKTATITSIDGNAVPIENDVDMNSHKITNLIDGTETTDSATVGQVNTAESNAVSTANGYTDTKVEAGITEANSYTDTQIESAMSDVYSIPAGGTTGQVLSKVDGTNYNVQWSDPAGGEDFVTAYSDSTIVTSGDWVNNINWAENEDIEDAGGHRAYATVYKINNRIILELTLELAIGALIQDPAIWLSINMANVLKSGVTKAVLEKIGVTPSSVNYEAHYKENSYLDSKWAIIYMGITSPNSATFETTPPDYGDTWSNGIGRTVTYNFIFTGTVS